MAQKEPPEKRFLLSALFMLDNTIDQSVCLCFFSSHIIIAVCVFFHYFVRLASVLCQNFIQCPFGLGNVICYNLDLSCLTLGTA